MRRARKWSTPFGPLSPLLHGVLMVVLRQHVTAHRPLFLCFDCKKNVRKGELAYRRKTLTSNLQAITEMRFDRMVLPYARDCISQREVVRCHTPARLIEPPLLFFAGLT